MLSYYQSMFFFLSFIVLLSLESTEGAKQCDWGLIDIARDFIRNKKSICRSDKAIAKHAMKNRANLCCVFDEETCNRTKGMFKHYLVKVSQGTSSYSLCPYSYFILLFLRCGCPDKFEKSPPVIPPEALLNNVSSEAYIAGGRIARRCEFPWVALLEVGNHICGGVVVSRRHVLTAAHCTKRTEGIVSLKIIDSRSPGGFKSHIKHVTIHPDYYIDPRYGRVNDIAILTLSRKIRFNKCVQPILLPDEVKRIKNKRNCYVAGWGSRNEISRTERFLHKVRVPIMTNRVCRIYVAGFDRKLLCAGYLRGGKDACSGDSGGPLMCPQDGRWVLAGLVSKGIGCARPFRPGIYTNVKHYIKWIRRYVP